MHVASVAATLLVRAMRTEEKELIGRRARRSAAADADSVWASASLLSKWQQVGLWLGQYTVRLTRTRTRTRTRTLTLTLP